MTGNPQELMKLIRARVEQRDPPIPLSQIARELGMDEGDLTRFIMTYSEPRKKLPVKRDGPPIALASNQPHEHWSSTQRAQRFANWKKARDGAARARLG